MAQLPAPTNVDERPEVSEVFIDAIPSMIVEPTGVVRFDFAITRFSEPRPPMPPKVTKRVMCRLVLNLNGFVELYNKMQQAHGTLKGQGIISDTLPPQPAPAPVAKH